MIGLVIATHAGLAAQLLEAAQRIVGPVARAQTLCMDRASDPEVLAGILSEMIDAVGCDGDGVLVMADMFGGTPANLAALFLPESDVEVINGVNLPMVLKFTSSRETMSLAELTLFLQDYARKSIVVSRELLMGAKEN
ncbi:MAG: PTS system fructose subfamily IIA component [Desulfuromonas sp.]|nr:MAG: PTS system fructose subfamily IIA component [Desulfuromonas sp.]